MGKAGKCGFIFASRSYRTVYARYHRAVKYERTVRGWVIEAKKAITIAVRSQKNQQEKCRCAVVKRRDTLWRTINNSRKRARQLKALQKCKMMQCVLSGTPVSSSKCKAVLKKLRNKLLSSKTEHAHNSKICHRRHMENKAKGEGRARSMLPRGQRRRGLPGRGRTRLLPRKGLPSAGGNKQPRLKSVPPRSAPANLSVPTSTRLLWRAGSMLRTTGGWATLTAGMVT